MDITALFPNKEQFDTMNILLAAIASGVSDGLTPEIKSFEDIQRVTRLGLASKLFVVGDQIQTEKIVSAGVGLSVGVGITEVSVDKKILSKNIDSLSNRDYTYLYTNVFTYDGHAWLNTDNETVVLSDWGITTKGTAAAGDAITISIQFSVLTFDVLDFDVNTPKDTNLEHSLTIGMHDVVEYGTIPFSAPQLMYYTIGGLPAGNYKFTLDHACYGNGTEYDGTYMFTTTKDIPATGGFRHRNIGGWKERYYPTDVLGQCIITYGASPRRDEIEKGIVVRVWDGTTPCVDLGTFTSQSTRYYVEDDNVNKGKRNFLERQMYGSNRWRDSAYRQWLNSDAPEVTNTGVISNWWTPKSVFDRIPEGANLAGFLYGLSPSFVNAMSEVEVITALCDCDRTGTETYDITCDKVWLQSRTEVYGQANNGVNEGQQFAYWAGTENSDKIKRSGVVWPRYWWLRSPHKSYADTPYGVYTSGAFDDYYAASEACGVVPACCIV